MESMQPRKLALIIALLPFVVTTLVFVVSAYEGYIPWCIPNFDGCVSISKAARNGTSLFIFRATMIAYGVLLIWFWIYVRQWLDILYGKRTAVANAILWLGIIGALSLIVYVDFLGTTGEFNRFMRRFGILIYFICIPLAQILLLRQHYHILPSLPKDRLNKKLLQFQFYIILLMLVVGIVSGVMEATYIKTDESENIAEWNLALLMQLYFLVTVFQWQEFRYHLSSK